MSAPAYSADQVLLAVYDAVNGALKAEISTLGGDVNPSPNNGDQVLLAAYDATNGLLRVNVVAGGGGSGTWRPVSVTSSAAGNFTVAHGLGTKPQVAVIEMTSGGAIWFQTPTRYDGTDLYLVASDAGLTATVNVQ